MSRPQRSPVPAASGPGHISSYLSRTYLSAYGQLYGNPLSRRNPRKRLPPYGKHLDEAIDRGLRPLNDVKLYVGSGAMDAARLAQDSILVALALPDGSRPADFRWPVAGCGVVVFETSVTGAELLQSLALELFKAGAHVVRVVHTTGGLTVYRAEGDA